MEFDELLTRVIALLQRQGRVSYGALKRWFHLDDDYLDDLKVELIEAQGLAADEQGRILVWLGSPTAAPRPTAPSINDVAAAPLTYTPPHLIDKILAARTALEGERKQVNVLFADLKGSMELLADRDPEEAQQLLDPAIHPMMAAVHRYERFGQPIFPAVGPRTYLSPYLAELGAYRGGLPSGRRACALPKR